MKKTVILFVVFITGCSGTKMLRYDIEQLQERQHKLETLVLDLSKEIDTVKKAQQSAKEESTNNISKQKNEVKSFYSRALEQIRDINREFSNTLDQSIGVVQEKTKSENALMRKNFDSKIEALKTSFQEKLQVLQKLVTDLKKSIKKMAGKEGKAGKVGKAGKAAGSS